jgi:hypothetical protein
MLMTEWNWDDALAVRYEEGLEQGWEEGRIKSPASLWTKSKNCSRLPQPGRTVQAKALAPPQPKPKKRLSFRTAFFAIK